MDYLEYFNLSEDPFRITPDPFYFYPSEEHNEMLASLDYAVEQKEGFFLLTGEPGTGKTTSLKVFIEKWKERAEIALIMTSRLSPEEFLLAVLEDFDIHLNATNKNEIIKSFRDFLLKNSALGRRVIIIVDEAQNLPDETLEELRLLSNLETEKEKLLQIVLIGQPELAGRLVSEGLKQLNQRITVRTILRPLTMEEVSDYINYRLIKAGKGSVLFEEQARKQIYKASKGVPRLINLLASRAIMAAYLDESSAVQKGHVMHALKHLSDNVAEYKGERVLNLKHAVMAVAIMLVSALVFSVIAGRSHKNTAVTQMPAAYKKVVVTVKSANLRARPAQDSEKVGVVSQNSSFDVLEERMGQKNKKWYRLNISEGSAEYWIAAQNVKVSD